MRTRVVFVLLVIAVTLSLVASQCAPVAVPQTVVETVVVTVEAEEEMSEATVIVQEEPSDLDPGSYSMQHIQITRNIYEGLTRRDPLTGEILPELAESWERIDDNTWRFRLRKGVVFHDGEPFNAEAAAWALNWMYDKELNKHILSAMGPQISAEAVDDYVLDVMTEAPDPIIPRRLVWAGMPSPKSIQDDPELTHQTAVGTGPYMLKEWVHGERIEMVVNPNYWGREPDFKTATYLWRPESSVRVAMIQAGEADVAAWITPQDVADIRIETASISEVPFLRLDVPSPPISDIRVRRAICMALDRDAIAEQIFAGYAEPANLLIGSDVMGYNPDVPVFPYDPEGAKELIEEARADGVPVDEELTIIGRNGIYANAAEAMEATQVWLTDIGLNVKLQMLDVSVWFDFFEEKPVPEDRRVILQLSHGNEMGDGILTANSYFHSEATYGYADDPQLDELIEKASPLIGSERQEAIAELFAYEHENVISACPMVNIMGIYGVSERLDWTPRTDNLILVKEMSIRD